MAVLRDGRKKGFGFIQFRTAEEALKAYEELDGVEFMGRPTRLKNCNIRAILGTYYWT